MRVSKLFSVTTAVVMLLNAASSQTAAEKFVEFEWAGCDPEVLHLERLAHRLHERPTTQGLIIVYAPRVGSHANTAAAYGGRMRRFLTEARGVEPARVRVVDGGFRERLSVELWLVGERESSPSATPTVSRLDVRMNKRRLKLRSCGEILGRSVPETPNYGLNRTRDQTGL